MIMSNMKYCMFQNTESDFSDCIERMAEEEVLELSREEKLAMDRLYHHCSTFISYYEDLECKVK